MGNLIQRAKIWLIVNILMKFWCLSEGIKVKIATSQEDLEKVFRFRWKIYSKYGYIEPEDFADQKLCDKYDKHSLNIIALKDDVPVGTVRLVFPSNEGLPTERAFNIINFNFPKNEVGEVSKLCLSDDCKDKKIRKKIFLILMGTVYKLSKKNKIKYWLVGISPSLREHFDTLNFNFSFIKLNTGPLTPANIEERKTAKRYFEKYQITPFLIII